MKFADTLRIIEDCENQDLASMAEFCPDQKLLQDG
jgi:hypothetical protein